VKSIWNTTATGNQLRAYFEQRSWYHPDPALLLLGFEMPGPWKAIAVWILDRHTTELEGIESAKVLLGPLEGTVQ
jgi:hypothetical protein